MKQINKEQLWSKDFIIVILLNFFGFLTHLMILSTFPFFVNYLGYTETVSGLCATLFSIVAVVSRAFIGWVLDNGKRRMVMLIGLCGMALLPMGYLLVYTVLASIVLTAILRMLHAVAFAATNTAAATMATDIVPKTRFAEGMGMFGMSTALATACAPAIGELLMNMGFQMLYGATTIIMVVGLILFFIMKNPKIEPSQKKFSVKDLVNRDALPASAVALIFVMTYGSLESYILKFATESDDVTLSGAFFFVAMAVMLLITRITVGKVADRRGEALFVYTCCPSMTAGLLILAFAPGNFSFVLAALLSGFAFGCIEPSLQAMAVSLSPPNRRGAANSTFLCVYDIGIGVGAGLAGVLIDQIGYHHMYAILSLASVTALILYLLIGRNHPSSITWQVKHRAENANK
ncbi:MAG: MFS transporter [Clostridiales bacterium]|nr:MFS transporter [Clostridiales bacterium]